MKRTCLALMTLAIAVTTLHVATQTLNPAGASTPLAPRLVGIVVRDLDRAKAWYGANLGFTVVDERAFPDRGLRISFLRHAGFELELVENKNARPRPVPSDQPDLEGFAKLAFTVPDVRALAETLRRNSTEILVPPTLSMRTQRLHMIVKDDSGNLVQFFE